MSAGDNIWFNIWRITESTDDYTGGAVITGTISYYSVGARMQEQPEELLLLQQGYEISKSFTVLIPRKWLDIKERDEVEVIKPLTNPFYGKRFRIVNIRYADFADPRGYMLLTLSRSQRSHSEQ